MIPYNCLKSHTRGHRDTFKFFRKTLGTPEILLNSLKNTLDVRDFFFPKTLQKKNIRNLEKDFFSQRLFKRKTLGTSRKKKKLGAFQIF